MVGYSKKNKNIIRKSVFDKRKKKPGFEQLGPGSKTLFTWSGGPQSSGVGFFCFVSPRAWKQKKPTPLDRGPPLHVNRP